MEELLKLKSV
jgi:hypothetical protein